MNLPRIHKDTIDAVTERVDIVEIVAEQVVLRKRGKDFVGLCPFHEEKTPSFTVSPSKQMFYCFGCGMGGSGVKFLMELGKQSFAEVVLELAQRYQIPVKMNSPEESQALQREISVREQLYEIAAIANSFFQHALRQSQGETAWDYLRKKRQLSEATIQKFGLGYAPTGWETLYRYLVDAKRFSSSLVEQVGLIKPRKNGDSYYDYFRDRLMIPICDAQGRVIAFGSRTLGNDEPKYLNSPETPLFSKGKTLFALDQAKAEISKQDRVVVVEGYFDAIALHAAGITPVVASLGTAFTPDQLKRILRYTESKQVILNFDADAAGTKATRRAIEEIAPLVYSGQVQLRVFNLPGGKDADEFLKSSADAANIYLQKLETAPLWIDWQIEQLLVNKDLNQANQFEQVSKEMVKLLNHLEDVNKRTYYVNYCAQLLSQGNSSLVSSYSQNLQAQLRRPKRKFNQPDQGIPRLDSEKNLLNRAEFILLLIYLHCPHHREEIVEQLEENDLIFSLAPHRFLWRKILEAETVHPQELLKHLRQLSATHSTEMNAVLPLLYLDENQPHEILRAPLLIRAAIASLQRVTYEKTRRHCLEQLKKLDPVQDADQFQYYSQELQNLCKLIQELDQMRYASLLDVLDS
ncbi:DNA primase [Spirulina subsalsa]|uniref:DNA primase n=1 Tax=Spirulina subsalsa TaxID=54311 RepID=UPI0002DE9CD1|nr:DNA primase [Spirulina subsalsa]